MEYILALTGSAQTEHHNVRDFMRLLWEQPWEVFVITCAYLSESSVPVIGCTATCSTASAVPVSGSIGWEDTKRFSCLCAWLGPLWSLTIKKDKLVICSAVWQCTEEAHKAESQKKIYDWLWQHIRRNSRFQNSVTSWNFVKCYALLILLASNFFTHEVEVKTQKHMWPFSLSHLRFP